MNIFFLSLSTQPRNSLATSLFYKLGRLSLVSLSLLLLFACCPETVFAQQQVSPNIIFIMADDLGYGDLGCYGQQQIKTPHIDQMASEGLRFTSMYAGSTVCAPSRCTLMTGFHTGHCRVRNNARIPLLPEDITVAEVLQKAGYKTAIFGKWGLGEPETTGIPNRQGFDTWYGYLNQGHAHNYYPAYLWRNEIKSPLANVVPGKGRFGSGVASKKVVYSHDLFTEEAIRFLKQDHDKPFFLYLPYTIPHANNEAGKQGMEVPSLGEYANREWPQPQQAHAAMISRLDSDVGKILALLKQRNLADNTLVLFTSDNGPHSEGGGRSGFFKSSGPLRGMKRSLHDGGIRVPMIAWMPGRITRGKTTDHACAFWDFLPTAAELADVAPVEGIDGTSFAPTLFGEKQQQPEFLYWEFQEGSRPFQVAVRHLHWKAIREKPNTPLLLFDLRTDIHEDNNVAAKNPGVIARIEVYLKSARSNKTSVAQWPEEEPDSTEPDESGN